MPHTPFPRRRRLPASPLYRAAEQSEPFRIPLAFTRHATQRMQQRGISASVAQTVVKHGREYYVGDGRRAYHLGRRAVAQVRETGTRVEEAQDISVVLSADGAVLTVQHMPRIPRFWRAA